MLHKTFPRGAPSSCPENVSFVGDCCFYGSQGLHYTIPATAPRTGNRTAHSGDLCEDTPKSQKNITYEQFRNELTRYLKTLIQYFPPLQEFDFYARVLTARNVRIELSLIAAQCASIIFEMHMAEYTSLPVARDQVNELLRVWPRILKASSKQNGTRPLIYSIYDLIDFDSVAECDAEVSYRSILKN